MNPKSKHAAAAMADPKANILNLSTYKWHSLGDYASTIRRYGTTDNYSMQTVCIITFYMENGLTI